MYLKKIETQGFKSFANKIVLEFNQGIMGIVGPNGSGKSNVADAVRWVLGEQSAKQLRGSNMQDVIFAGTENRKPQGYAYVALTIDNADHLLPIDYDEVTISRRVYRSGESEYLINGNVCRLKDVYELFYDTGVGKEGYSIIGQGQIDKILSGKPEDRRDLFDEAAGIVKFKKRKGIAQKKLEGERQNLVRVSDILSELEKQVGPLEKHSEKARQYLKLKEELKSYEIGAFFLESTELQNKLAAVNANLEIVTADLAKSQQEAEDIKARYDVLTEKNEALDRTMEESRSALSETRVEKESLEGRIRVLVEQIRTAQMNDDHIRARMEVIEEEIGSRICEKENFVADKGELNELLDETDNQVERLEEVLAELSDQIRAYVFEIETRKGQIIEGLNKKAEISAGDQKFKTQLEQARLTRSELHQFLLTARAEEEAQESQVEKLRAELVQVQAHLAELTEEQSATEKQSAEADQELKRQNRKLNDCQQEYHTLKTRLESLINITERYEGYGNSIRRVMEKKSEMPGIVGVVADLLHVEKKYETAMETALGGRIQNVVTEDEETAKSLITYLKQNKYGRATFLPISSVSSNNSFPRPEALKEAGALGVGTSLVTVDKAYEGIANHLLGRVLVTDTIDHALAIARKYKHSLHIVTLEGEYLSPGGSLTGGTFKNATNLLGRRREIEELEAAIKKSLKTYDAVKDELVRKERTVKSLRERLEELQEQVHQGKLKETRVSLNLVRGEDQLEGIRQGYKSRREETEVMQIRITEIEAQEAGMKQEAEDLEAESSQLQAEIEDLNRKLAQERQKQEEKARELASVQVEFSNLTQKDTFILENILRVSREMEKLIAEKAELEESITQGGGAVWEREEEIAQTRDRILHVEERMRTLNEKLAEETARKEEHVKEQNTFFDAREEESRRIASLDKDAYRLQIQKERMDEGLEKQVEYLWTEYELTPSEAEEQRDETLTELLPARRAISQRKNQIRELGPVNVNAIEDYKEVSERYEFLKVQHADLIEAEESLRKIIVELDQGMRKQFEEKFTAIRLEFDRVFKELFGGGKGTLELLESEDKDILEAGIAIIAQPPGKKLQNMMQLSGGEKALTAIALLFAIQNLKPSPFCLLDEIEAALDEPNVARYAEYLNKLKEHTQFIVITHRRGTMEMADRLYGVTMQEKGVSALVSVDLTDSSLVN